MVLLQVVQDVMMDLPYKETHALNILYNHVQLE